MGIRVFLIFFEFEGSPAIGKSIRGYANGTVSKLSIWETKTKPNTR